MKAGESSNKWLWASSLLFFILAGSTGVLFRIGMVGGEMLGLTLQNIRHAHSHLMFFGWAGLFPLVIMFHQRQSVPSRKGYRWMKYSLQAILMLALVAYLFFLRWGYHPVSVGQAQLPLAAICSSFVMIAWYTFAVGYSKAGNAFVGEDESWFSLALVMLIVSSAGAWGVGILQFFEGEQGLLSMAMTHFFLGTFTEGWVVLALIGMMVKSLKLKKKDFRFEPGKLRILIALGAPLTFSYGINYSLLTPQLLWSAQIGGVISSVALLLVVAAAISKCRNSGSFWWWPVLLLGLKGFIQLLLSVYPHEMWLSNHYLRIFYLHTLLLGAFSIGCVAWLHQRFRLKPFSFYILVYSCLLVLLSLVLPTGLVPQEVKGAWIFYAMAVAAAFPVLAAIYQFIQLQHKTSLD